MLGFWLVIESEWAADTPAGSKLWVGSVRGRTARRRGHPEVRPTSNVRGRGDMTQGEWPHALRGDKEKRPQGSGGGRGKEAREAEHPGSEAGAAAKRDEGGQRS